MNQHDLPPGDTQVPRFKLVIFDFDGTLADTFPWFLHVINDAAQRFSFNPVAQHEHKLLQGFSARRVLRYLDVPLWKLPMIAAYMHRRMAGDIDHIQLFPGTASLLETLPAHNIALGVVSSNAYKNVCSILGSSSSTLINHYECGVSVFGKAARLKNILAACGIQPQHALYVGDEIRDIEAAQSIHLACGAVTWGYNSSEALKAHAPDMLFNSFDEILAAAT
ncbi:MAG: HAD hydrolase-like protein [Deltaproteobacteria bacterium]|nr:HAD hydrolase-like protein [Deltaproteobacteria bacterium]